MPEPLSAQQEGFIQASLAERGWLEREAKAAEEKRLQEKQELEERERKQERNARVAAEKVKRISWIGMMVLSFIAAIAYLQYREADKQRLQVSHQSKALLSQLLVMKGKELNAQNYHTKATLLAALALQVQPTQAATSFAISLLTGEFRSRPLRGHEGGVNSVAFSPDGTRIVSGSRDQTLRLWDAKLLEDDKGLYFELCTTLHRNLTKEEWAQYMPEEEDYREVCKLYNSPGKQ